MGAVIALVVIVPLIGTTPVEAGPPPGPPVLVDLEVTGVGVTPYPAFDPGITRYGLRTKSGTRAIDVTATTEDPGDVLTVAGVPAVSGEPFRIPFVRPGEEITVEVTNANGTTPYGIVKLDRLFPIIDVRTSKPGVAEGFLFASFLPFNVFFAVPPYINAVFDDNGVPVYADRRPQATFDFKPQPGGQYGYLQFRPDDAPAPNGPYNSDFVVLDGAMNETGRFRTVPPVKHTDNHESLILDNGNRILVAYDPVRRGGSVYLDAVVQEVTPAGVEVLRWRSNVDIPLADHVSGNLTDYAHLNSVAVDHDGHLLVSLRGTNQVVKINRQTGDLIWKLGGRSSDFTITDPLGGFCGQHSVHRLDNGNLLMFDNGVDCLPDLHERNNGRAAEYELDEQAMTAELVWSYDQGIDSFATGSAQRFENGNTLIGWGSGAGTTEVDEDGNKLLDMAFINPVGSGPAILSYRSKRAPFPDQLAPRPVVASPADRTVVALDEVIQTDYRCFDTGGSSLDSCEGDTPVGTSIDTSTLGQFTYTVTATDHAGNATPVTTTYDVAHAAHGFTDVPYWVEVAVRWARAFDHIDGYGDDTFRPDRRMTRGQLARVLYRIADSPDVSDPSFDHDRTDVPAWLEDAVRWITHDPDGDGPVQPIATGYADGTFGPNRPITRGELARILHRAVGEPAGSPPNQFSDVPDWVDGAVDWLTDPVNDPPFASGYDDNTFRPRSSATRAQVTRMLYRINN